MILLLHSRQINACVWKHGNWVYTLYFMRTTRFYVTLRVVYLKAESYLSNRRSLRCERNILLLLQHLAPQQHKTTAVSLKLIISHSRPIPSRLANHDSRFPNWTFFPSSFFLVSSISSQFRSFVEIEVVNIRRSLFTAEVRRMRRKSAATLRGENWNN